MDGNGRTTVGRRALLAAGAAGVAAAAAQAMAPGRVLADNGDPLKIGATNTGSAETILQVSSSTGLSASSSGGDGLAGGTAAAAKSGVYGYSRNADGYGVFGRNLVSGTEGALGSGREGVYGSCAVPSGSAVLGVSTHADSAAVAGTNRAARTAGGFGGLSAGVYGVAPDDATDRVGLWVQGRVSFTRSGTLTIAARTSSISTAMPALSATSMVLATLQTNRAGVYIQAAVANPATGRITIYLNRRVTAATKVAYFVLG
jgi:hypothetical protein